MTPRSMMLFDATGYLGRIDPTQSYTIDVLTGGIMNITLRATKTTTLGGGRFPDQPSVILKYAPPFVAAVGERLAMTTFRQVIEARALSLFSHDGRDALSQISSPRSVMVPRLLYHDSDANVLIMSDMGLLPNLSSVFSDLGGYSTGNFLQGPKTIAQPSRSSEQTELISYYGNVGARLGAFFAKLHSPASLSVILQDPERGPYFLNNPHLANFAFENGIKPIKANLELFPQLLSKDDASVLYERAAKDNTKAILDEERSVTLTDCWPGSLLVSPFPQSSPENPAKIAVVDWEFASIGRGVNNDLAQLLARFALLHCAAECKQDVLRQKELSALVSAITISYHEISIEERSAWTICSGKSTAKLFADLDERSLRVKMLRSAFLTHGIEIMRCAFGKSWNCEDDRCMVGMKHTTQKHECVMIKAMVERALWYFRHAKDDEREFCSEENCVALQQAYEDGKWLLNLF